MPRDETRLITRTPAEEEALARKAAQAALDAVLPEVSHLRHQARIDTGTCYTSDLAWLWECSEETVRRRMDAAGVDPLPSAGRRHLWDVEAACSAFAATSGANRAS